MKPTSISAAALAATLLTTACTSTIIHHTTYYTDTSHTAQYQDTRIRFLVMHYTEIDEKQSLDVLTHEQVSAHYVIPDHPKEKTANQSSGNWCPNHNAPGTQA